jgi:hypothetical protein
MLWWSIVVGQICKNFVNFDIFGTIVGRVDFNVDCESEYYINSIWRRWRKQHRCQIIFQRWPSQINLCKSSKSFTRSHHTKISMIDFLLVGNTPMYGRHIEIKYYDRMSQRSSSSAQTLLKNFNFQLRSDLHCWSSKWRDLFFSISIKTTLNKKQPIQPITKINCQF